METPKKAAVGQIWYRESHGDFWIVIESGGDMPRVAMFTPNEQETGWSRARTSRFEEREITTFGLIYLGTVPAPRELLQVGWEEEKWSKLREWTVLDSKETDSDEQSVATVPSPVERAR